MALSESSKGEFEDVMRQLGADERLRLFNPRSTSPTTSDQGLPDAVVLGLAPTELTYQRLNEAFMAMRRAKTDGKEIPFIACNRSKAFIKDDKGTMHLGTGPFVTALEEATGQKAVVVGKPSLGFFRAAVAAAEKNMGWPPGTVQPHQVVMVGDDAKDDVEGAKKAGFRAVLLRTGKYQPGDESRVNPDAVFDTFGDFCAAVERSFHQLTRL